MNILLMTSAAPEISAFSTNEKTAPIGIGFLISVLRNAGHKVHFADNYLSPANIQYSEFLTQNRIDWVGIYANTVCFQSTLSMLYKLQSLRERKIWQGKIMVGGPHTSVSAESIPDFVDNVVIGEGEISILKIVSGQIDERIVYGEKVKDLDSLPFPAWDQFIYRPYNWHSKRQKKGYPMYTFNTSRGCPFSCAFCSVGSVWGHSYRYMSGERVLNDVQYMIKYYNLRSVYFREDHFTLNKKRVIRFCEGLLRREIDISWMCETRVDNFEDEEYIALMARSGCKEMYIGVESGSPRMLEFMNKGETVEQFINAFDLAKKFGVETYASFVVGAPTETEEDLKLTRKLIERIKPAHYNLNVYTGLPGSKFYDYVQKNNLYEFKDANGILYLKGHDQRIDRFSFGSLKAKIPYPYRKRMFKMRKQIISSVKNMWPYVKSGIKQIIKLKGFLRNLLFKA